MPMIDVSTRQAPVISRLTCLVDETKAVASAVLDNAVEESRPIPRDAYQSLCTQMEEIKTILRFASHG